LLPASWLFGAGVALRNAAYRLGLLKSERAGIAVVSVGNLCVGGTGKTPLALWLARQLAADGTKVALLLRGYGGNVGGATLVSRGGGPQAHVEDSGDEAIMLAKCFGGVVLTANRRIEGVREAQSLGCRIVVLDDGFQHRALERDFDLVLVDEEEGSLLPAGPMREGYGALDRADASCSYQKKPTTVPGVPVRAKPTYRGLHARVTGRIGRGSLAREAAQRAVGEQDHRGFDAAGVVHVALRGGRSRWSRSSSIPIITPTRRRTGRRSTAGRTMRTTL
jgi:tetraacyldisaccharide 4'-kinase